MAVVYVFDGVEADGIRAGVGAMTSVGQAGACGDVLVVVANYEFNEQAVWLKNFFSPHFKTLLVDSSSPVAPCGVDRVIKNNGYRGLWNDAVGQAIEGGFEWLFFIASDVQLVRSKLMIHCMMDIAGEDSISLWTPSLVVESRHAYPTCTHQASSILRTCGAVEGFCFMARTSVLQKQYPVQEENRFGFGIDMATSILARDAGDVVVDDRVAIFHPVRKSEHQIDETLADRLGFEYLDRCGLDPDILRDVDHAEYWAKMGKIMPVYGAYRSLDLDCNESARDPFSAHDTWGICRPHLEGGERVLRADLASERIPFDDWEFDYVCAIDFIDTIPVAVRSPNLRLPLHALMNEVCRVLKPGGLFLSISRISSTVEHVDSHLCGIFCMECRLVEWFCGDSPPAALNGFKGAFYLERQCLQPDGTILTLMRAHG